MQFKPKTGHPYWMINSRWEVKQSPNTNSKRSKDRIRVGNCFRTREDAEAYLAVMKNHQPMTRWQHLKKAVLGS